MLINELKLRNLQISTGNVNTAKAGNAEKAAQQSGGTFAEALQSELDAKVAEYEQSIDKLNELVRGGTTAMRLSLHKKYVSSLQQDIYRIKGLMAHKREEIENQLQKVIDATKEVSKLEKLEEKQLEEYRYASQKEQEQIIEEFVTNGSSNGGNTP